VQGKPNVVVMLSDDVVHAGIFHAGRWVKELAVEIDGGGGGQPHFAMAGGKKVEGLPNIISKATEKVQSVVATINTFTP